MAQSRLFKGEALHLRFTNGTERFHERMQGGHRGAVMLVPLLDDDTLLLVREYAAGTHSYELGFPKGVIDAGENAAQAGNRELMEETGYGARELIPLKQVALAPGFFASRMDLLLARDSIRNGGKVMNRNRWNWCPGHWPSRGIIGRSRIQ